MRTPGQEGSLPIDAVASAVVPAHDAALIWRVLRIAARVKVRKLDDSVT